MIVLKYTSIYILKNSKGNSMKKVALISMFMLHVVLTCVASKSVKISSQKIKKLTMENAVVMAMKRKPSIKAFDYDIKNFKKQRKGTLSDFIPNVSLSETFYNAKNTIDDSLTRKSAFGISINFCGFRPINGNQVLCTCTMI